MKDKAPQPAVPEELLQDDDDIEIIEVVGLDEDAPAGAAVEAGELEDGDVDEVVVSFDPAEPSVRAQESGAPAPPSSDAGEDPEDRLLRLQAEFENLKKRFERERDEYYKQATASLVSRVLRVVDNFERALGFDPDDGSGEAFRDGVALIYRQLMDELRKEGLRPVEAVGQAFDPNEHEAVATEAVLDHPPNTVLEELQRGYFLYDRLLRPARVKVSVGPADDAETNNGGEES